jgi:hypothetical protein
MLLENVTDTPLVNRHVDTVFAIEQNSIARIFEIGGSCQCNCRRVCAA